MFVTVVEYWPGAIPEFSDGNQGQTRLLDHHINLRTGVNDAMLNVVANDAVVVYKGGLAPMLDCANSRRSHRIHCMDVTDREECTCLEMATASGE